MGARDEGKAAAERRWVGASPYEWDGRDKLRTIRKPDGTRLDYSYDVFGRRVSKTRSGGPFDDKRVEFVWDGEVLACELDTETGPRTFVHEPGGFEPILQQQGGETYLCVNDHLGMPKELIDGGGNLAWAAAHSAYGKVIATQGPDGTDSPDPDGHGGVESPFRLLGQVNDEDAELAWTRFRCFDAETGTWISTDPLGLVGGTQTYGFDGSPADVVDPLGLSTSGGSPHAGQKLYRVYGGDSQAGGASWSPVDPRTVPDYRDAAGLPSGGASGANNTGRFVIEGTLQDPAAVVLTRPALPLDGKKGGLEEYIIPKWRETGAVRVDRVSGANSEF